MKIDIKKEFIVADIKKTKNENYFILLLGDTDFTGTTSFLVEKEKIATVKKHDLVEVDFFIQVANEKRDDEYLEVVKNKRIVKISTK